MGAEGIEPPSSAYPILKFLEADILKPLNYAPYKYQNLQLLKTLSFSNNRKDKFYKQIPPINNMPRKRKPVVETKIEDKLLENLISLQKVHTDLAEKFDKLTKEISNLLALFELTAKNFSKEAPEKMGESDKEFLDKINKLLEQNKTIAKGLTLMEEQMRKKMYHPQKEEEEQQKVQPESEYVPSMGRPLPKF